MADKFVHVLISATYSTSVPIPSKVLSDVLADRLMRTTDLHTVMSYSMPYAITPMDCGLKEQWSKLTPEEIELLGESHPDLVTAIALICGDNDERQPGTAKDSSASKN